jgi:Putative esterase
MAARRLLRLASSRGGRGAALVIGALALSLAVLSTAALADPSSLYTGPGPRPGPDILYAPLAAAPQLDNAPSSVWQASPILVSGASAYRSGEFLYQDFLYDDHGARGSARDTGDPRTAGDSFSAPNGTYTYPTSAAYANNAADLVELRVRPLSGATAFRVTLNTLNDPSLVGFTVALGGTPGEPVAWPHGANVVAPAEFFLTVHGNSADLLDAAGNPVNSTGPGPSVSVDLTRRQFTVLLPHTEWDPTGQSVRLAAGVGLWDNANDRYLLPQTSADATHPGGAAGLVNPAAFFNLAFRFNGQEPFPKPDSSSSSDPAWWRDRAQGHALAAGDISQFFANADFPKLAAATNDDMPGQPQGVPQTGPIDRILASHYETEQGADYSTTCGNSTGCKGELRGQLQPYAIYVPANPPPSTGYGLTLLLHSLGANYNQFESTRNQSQFGDRGTGSIVITPSGRGPDGWYYEYAGADTFEVWADVAARFTLDSDWTSIAGYSMGGYGTYKFATQFPDLFAKAQPTVGPPGLGIWAPPADPEPGGAQSNTYRQLASLRNIPFLIWDASSDELVPLPGPVQQAQGFDALGYRYEFDVFSPAEHLTLAINDQFQPGADFLGTTRVDRNPAHVSYAYNPTMDFPAVGTAAGHAYWVSGITLRDSSGTAPLGTIDVRSEGFGLGDPTPSPTTTGSGTLTGGTIPSISYTSQSRTWGPAPATPVADVLDINATNISAITVDVARAHVDCNVTLNITSNGPLAVKLQGCDYARPKGATPLRVPLVVAYKPCSSPNRTHGAPLAFGSCSPPGQASDQLTVGTPDANGKASNSVGFVRYDVVPGDVRMSVSITDVRNKSDLSDYTGQLQVDQSLRITDSQNGSAPNQAGTVQDTHFPVTVPCTGTADATSGSSCAVSTTADAVVPGALSAGSRAIWELGQIGVYDGGPDGLAGTQPNTLFADQGIFIP